MIVYPRGKKTHGESKTKLYQCWRAMRGRCNDPRYAAYPRYGGRGISVCQEWSESFEAFRNWAIENGYAENLQVDRIDNDGDYEPSNCRWVGYVANNRNKRNNTILEAFGESKCMAEWVEDSRCVVSRQMIRKRLNLGWTAQSAMSTPV